MNKGGARWGKGGASSPCHTWGRNRYVVSTCPTLCQPRVPSWNCPTLDAPPSRLGNESRTNHASPRDFTNTNLGGLEGCKRNGNPDHQAAGQPRDVQHLQALRSVQRGTCPATRHGTGGTWHVPTPFATSLWLADRTRQAFVVWPVPRERTRIIAASDAQSEPKRQNPRENRPDAAQCCRECCKAGRHAGFFRGSRKTRHVQHETAF